jgi:hypothetical protein
LARPKPPATCRLPCQSKPFRIIGMGRVVVLLALVVTAACAKGSPMETDRNTEPDARVQLDAPHNGCDQQPCSILPQCGCSGPTACDVDSADDEGTACRSITTPGTETTACASATDCDRGFICLGGSGASCKRYCDDNADCGSPRGRCVLRVMAGGTPVEGIPAVCTSNCDPRDLTAALCPSKHKCTLFTINRDGTAHKVVDCSLAGTRVQGGDCTSATNGPNESMCAKGYQCVKLTSEPTYKCRRICTGPTAMSSQCNNMQCIGFNPAHTISGVTYGVCAP